MKYKHLNCFRFITINYKTSYKHVLKFEKETVLSFSTFSTRDSKCEDIKSSILNSLNSGKSINFKYRRVITTIAITLIVIVHGEKKLHSVR